MTRLVSSNGVKASFPKGITTTGNFTTNGSNRGIANGRNNTIKVGYDGYVNKKIKSDGKSGDKVATKNFGRERSDD